MNGIVVLVWCSWICDRRKEETRTNDICCDVFGDAQETIIIQAVAQSVPGGSLPLESKKTRTRTRIRSKGDQKGGAFVLAWMDAWVGG